MVFLGATTINPRVIFVSSIEPSDKTKGKLWYNTTNNSLYTSNGTNYVLLENDLTDFINQNLQQNLNILINSAGASTTLNDYDNMFLDIFSDADGTDNTINTGNTDAVFLTNKYANGSSSIDAHGKTFNNTYNTANSGGVKIHTNTSCTITTVVKPPLSTATRCILENSAHTVLETVSFSGDTATLSTALTNNTDYWVLVDNNGSAMNHRNADQGTAIFPINKTNINYISTWINGLEVITTYIYDILSIETTNTPSNKVIQTNMQTITANPTAHQVYCHNAVAGTGSVTYDISFDNGSTWVTGQAVNTKNTSVHNGTQLVFKLNLNGVGAGNTAEANDYAIMLFY